MERFSFWWLPVIENRSKVRPQTVLQITPLMKPFLVNPISQELQSSSANSAFFFDGIRYTCVLN